MGDPMYDHPRIITPCPSCGSSSLFIGSAGHLTCSILDCKEPRVGLAIGALQTIAQSKSQPPASAVNHPAHYGGVDNPYEAIRVIEAWDLGFCLGNTIKYIARAGKKSEDAVTDLEKASWYLQREIETLRAKTSGKKG